MRSYRKIIVCGCMLTGFLSGILFINLSGNSYLEKSSFLIQKVSEITQFNEIQKNEYLYFLIKRRGGLYILLALLGQTLGGQVWIVLYGVWFSFSEGIFLTSTYLQCRLTGIWIAILAQMPYSLCYGMIYVLLVKKYIVYNGKRGRYDYLRDWVLYLPIMIIGILSEFYITPWWISILLKHLI